jgi:hypothetical protein
MDRRFKTIEKRARRTFFLAIVIVLAIMMSLGYLVGSGPSEVQACQQSCAAHGRQGELIHELTAEQTAGMRGRGRTECQCR